MTSEQTEALQAFKDKSAEYLLAAATFGHAFGQDNPGITAAVESTAQSVGETAHTIAAWSYNK
ncbi:MAG TPA: hypothetical protein VMU16_04300 [Candidatus Binataceae bacterium]|nr:hypothetical protein [Candidatus Binataceae bacterium]